MSDQVERLIEETKEVFINFKTSKKKKGDFQKFLAEISTPKGKVTVAKMFNLFMDDCIKSGKNFNKNQGKN